MALFLITMNNVSVPMTREEVLDIFYKDGKMVTGRLTKTYLIKHNYFDRLVNVYPDSSSVSETVYRIVNCLEEKPKCKVCGKPLEFKHHKFLTYCSAACSTHDPEVLAKNKAGVSKSLKKAYEERHDEIIAKRAKSLGNNTGSPFSNPESRVKGKETIMERYGVDNIFRLPEFRENSDDHRARTKELWKSRCVDVYYEGQNIIVHNACEIHKDISIPIGLFHARWRRTPLLPDGTHDIRFLCRECHPIYMSNIERQVADILDKHCIDYEFRNRQIIKPLEIDFWIPEANFGIECNGIYWHSTKKVAKDYHLNKFLASHKTGIKILSLWEDDTLNVPEFTEALILSNVFGYEPEYWEDIDVNRIKLVNANIIKRLTGRDTEYVLEINKKYALLTGGGYSQVLAGACNKPGVIYNLELATQSDLNFGGISGYSTVHRIEGKTIECHHTGYIIK